MSCRREFAEKVDLEGARPSHTEKCEVMRVLIHCVVVLIPPSTFIESSRARLINIPPDRPSGRLPTTYTPGTLAFKERLNASDGQLCYVHTGHFRALYTQDGFFGEVVRAKTSDVQKGSDTVCGVIFKGNPVSCVEGLSVKGSVLGNTCDSDWGDCGMGQPSIFRKKSSFFLWPFPHTINIMF